MPYIDLADARYWYETGGQQSGENATNPRPLLLLHGFMGSSAGWADLASALPRPTIAVDLPGHGATQVPLQPERYAMESVAADLAACIRTLAEGPIHLLGYSMGGRLALYVAVHYPDLVASLILESSSPGLEEAQARAERQTTDGALALRIEHDGLEAFVDYWEALPLFAGRRSLPDEVQERLRVRQLQNSGRALATSLRGMGTGVQPPLWHRLADLSLPVLLITGALDTKFCAINRRMQQCIPSARHVVIDRTGHTVHLEEPAAYRAEVAAFLDRQSSPC